MIPAHRWLFPVLLAMALGSLLLLWFARGSGPAKDPGRDLHIDSAKVIQAAADSAIAHADSVIARAARDSSVQQLADSAARIGRRLDSLDRLAATWRRVAKRRADSLAGLTLQVDSMIGNVAGTELDTGTVDLTPPDSSLSCESRYAGRLAQLSMLGEALERCRARGDTVRSALVGLRDTTALLRTYAAASDSLLRWERDRPRPCRVSLGLASVSCGTAMGGTALLSFLGGIFVGR